MTTFWNDFETFVGVQIPYEIMEILTLNGYDSSLALDQIDDDEINAIESKIVGSKWIEVFKKSKYYLNWDPVQKFSLIPGHRKLIKVLGQKVTTFEKEQVSNSKFDEFVTFSNASPIMKELLINLKVNENIASNKRRYSEMIQWFSTYIFMLAGKAAYEVLSANLPIPQAATVLNYIHKRKENITEGELRCEGLAAYLKKLNAPSQIWLSEDASGIVSKVEYDNKTNQLIGLVQPTSQNTGMPIPFSFVPQTVTDIEALMKGNAKSTLVYLVLAQPLMKNVPPYILQIYGSDNTFKSKDVLLRWKHTQDQLERHGIEVLGISGDGDTRILTCMKHSSNAMMNQSTSNVLDNLNREKKISFVQDVFHWDVKVRNRMLKSSILLPIGCKQVSVSHLKILIQTVSKETHGIVLSDISPFDRQNVNSFKKISSDRTLNALQKYVPDAEATVMYLKLTRKAGDAFTEEEISPLDRIHDTFRALYFFRGWRKWLETYENDQSIKYDVEKNFLSQNAFTCLELNAYNLLNLITKLRDSNQDHLFMPSLFSSQNCEHTFRRFRSMTTANWTKINFSMCEVLHMVARVELMNDISFFKLSKSTVFPRIQNQTDVSRTTYSLPENTEIQAMLEKALETALFDLTKFEISADRNDILSCDIKKHQIPAKTVSESDDGSNIEIGLSGAIDCTYFRDYSETNSDNVIDENSKFVNIFDEDGSTKLIKKSAIVWLLSERSKLSNDRLKRVQARKENESNGPKRKCASDDILKAKKYKTENNLYESEIEIGNWCIFKNENHGIILGSVLAFKYVNGRTEKDKQYCLDSVVTHSTSTNERPIEVLALWYKLNDDFSLQRLKSPSFFVSKVQYLGHINPPDIDQSLNSNEKKYKITKNIDDLKKIISKFN